MHTIMMSYNTVVPSVQVTGGRIYDSVHAMPGCITRTPHAHTVDKLVFSLRMLRCAQNSFARILRLAVIKRSPACGAGGHNNHMLRPSSNATRAGCAGSRDCCLLESCLYSLSNTHIGIQHTLVHACTDVHAHCLCTANFEPSAKSAVFL